MGILSGLYCYTFVTSDNLIVAPIIINETAFPVGVLAYSDKKLAEKRMSLEAKFTEKYLTENPTVTKCPYSDVKLFQFEETISLDVYLQSSLFVFFQAINLTPLKGIAGIAEEEFTKCNVYLDPPILRVNDQISTALKAKGLVRPLREFTDVNLDGIIAWHQKITKSKQG